MKNLFAVLNKFLPLIILGSVGYIGYLGYGFYNWKSDPNSELGQKTAQIAPARTALEASKKKLRETEDFIKNLELVKTRTRVMQEELESAKSSMADEVDLPSLLKTLSLEAKTLGLAIKKLKPENEQKKEFYVEVPFGLEVRGAFVQVLVFFDRIAKFKQILKVDNFDLTPQGDNTSKYVQLNVQSTIVAYKYIPTQADTIAKSSGGVIESAEKLKTKIENRSKAIEEIK